MIITKEPKRLKASGLARWIREYVTAWGVSFSPAVQTQVNVHVATCSECNYAELRTNILYEREFKKKNRNWVQTRLPPVPFFPSTRSLSKRFQTAGLQLLFAIA